MSFWFNSVDDYLPRYESQLRNVDELVLHTLHQKHGLLVDKEDLDKILRVLYEFRVID